MNDGFDYETDVVIVGLGAAGAAAALTAASSDAKAIVLERQPSASHTPNTRMSGGLVMGVNNVEGAVIYLDACGGGMIPVAVSRAWAERALNLVGWLDEQGLDLHMHRVGGPEHTDVPGASAIDVYLQGLPRDEFLVDQGDLSLLAAGMKYTDRRSPMRRAGRELYAALRLAVEGRSSVEIRWEHRVLRLTTDEVGAVTGVERSMGRRRCAFGPVLASS